jgi:hypothetical protein
VPRVEGRLAAAHLARRKLDLEPSLAKQELGVGGGLRKDEVAEAGGKELDAPLSDTGSLLAPLSASRRVTLSLRPTGRRP